MLRSLLCLTLLASSFMLFAQPRVGNLYTTNPYPYYVLSPDGKTLAVYQVGEPKKSWLTFIDLNTFNWLPESTISLDRTFLSPDFKSAYAGEFNGEGFKGNQEWIAFKKYLSWYYPNSTSTEKIQWADRNFILAVRSDGKLLTAGSLRFKKNKYLMYPVMTVVDLNITDPLTGNVISNLRKGDIMEISQTWFNKEQLKLVDNDNLLMWKFGPEWTSFNLTTTAVTPIRSYDELQAFSGKYGMAATFKDATIGAFKYRKLVMNLETGKAVHDEMISTINVMGYWCAAGPANSFYTFNAKTSELMKEEIIDDKLVVTKKVKLDITYVDPTSKWQYMDHGFYRLVVSEPLGIALLLPTTYKSYGTIAKMILGWQIEDGKLVYVNYDFIKPTESYVQRAAAEDAALLKRITPAKPTELPLNTLLNTREGFHVLLGHEQNVGKWRAIKYKPTADGNFTPSETFLTESDFTKLYCEVVSGTRCTVCNGHGTVTSVQQRTSEKVDKMIYNQITTTTTYDVRTTKACERCKGVGFQY